MSRRFRKMLERPAFEDVNFHGPSTVCHPATTLAYRLASVMAVALLGAAVRPHSHPQGRWRTRLARESSATTSPKSLLPPQAKSTRPPEMARWTPSDLQTFLDFTAVERLGLPLPFAPTTGMRRGEVCGVRWSDVDLDKGRVEVR